MSGDTIIEERTECARSLWPLVVPPVAVLFARADSIYKTLPECDVWDRERDARNWPGGAPIVAHPPCGPWGQLAGMCNATQEEKDLGPWAVDQVRKWGGCLEHPIGSKLWRYCGISQNGSVDKFGGFSIIFAQWWFGHRAEKWTRIYFCGITHDQLPPTPYKIGEPTHVIAQSRKNQALRTRPEVTKPEREHTPVGLATWLLGTARLSWHNKNDVPTLAAGASNPSTTPKL